MEKQVDLFSEENNLLFKSLKERVVTEFFKYHRANPHIFNLFVHYAHEIRRTGREKYGAQSIIERVRWHTEVEVQGSDLKISNNHASCYARLLMIQDPSFAHFFDIYTSDGRVIER